MKLKFQVNRVKSKDDLKKMEEMWYRLSALELGRCAQTNPFESPQFFCSHCYVKLIQCVILCNMAWSNSQLSVSPIVSPIRCKRMCVICMCQILRKWIQLMNLISIEMKECKFLIKALNILTGLILPILNILNSKLVHIN